MASSAPAIRLSVLDRYILAEVLAPFAVALTSFCVFWVFSILNVVADYIVNHHASFFLVMRFLALRLPEAIPMAFPFATLFAGLIAMSRLIGDNEVVAMRAGGISVARIVRVPAIVGFVMFVVSYAANEYITPNALEQSTRTFAQMVFNTAALPIEPQFFLKDNDSGNVFYVSQIAPDKSTMQGVYIFKPARFGPWSESIQAKRAVVSMHDLVLYDVIDTRYNAQGYVSGEQRVKTLSIGIPLGQMLNQFTESNQDPAQLSTKALSGQVKAMKQSGMSGAQIGTYETSLAARLSRPFACFISMILAVALAVRFGRYGRTLAMALALGAFFVYYLLDSAAMAIGRNGVINPYVAAWLPNVLFAITGFLLLRREEWSKRRA